VFHGSYHQKDIKNSPHPACHHPSELVSVAAPQVLLPRRSRRIAGVEPEVVNATSSTRNKKKVMRALDIPGETEGISQEALEQYTASFSLNPPL
jgi:hypothetical protein